MGSKKGAHIILLRSMFRDKEVEEKGGGGSQQ
jgi:hypothetical protein